MSEGDKLAYKIFLGFALVIGGTYGLIQIFGESYLFSVLVLVGWCVLLFYVLKYHNLIKRGR